jgi:hypothetical protein
MKAKRLSIILVVALAAAAVSCYRPYGYHLYPETPRFAPTHPASVDLLRREPRGDHIRLGEVWIRPSRYADRYYVESVLREKAALMGADALSAAGSSTTTGTDRGGSIVGRSSGSPSATGARRIWTERPLIRAACPLFGRPGGGRPPS